MSSFNSDQCLMIRFMFHCKVSIHLWITYSVMPFMFLQCGLSTFPHCCKILKIAALCSMSTDSHCMDYAEVEKLGLSGQLWTIISQNIFAKNTQNFLQRYLNSPKNLKKWRVDNWIRQKGERAKNLLLIYVC